MFQACMVPPAIQHKKSHWKQAGHRNGLEQPDVLEANFGIPPMEHFTASAEKQLA